MDLVIVGGNAVERVFEFERYLDRQDGFCYGFPIGWHHWTKATNCHQGCCAVFLYTQKEPLSFMDLRADQNTMFDIGRLEFSVQPEAELGGPDAGRGTAQVWFTVHIVTVDLV